MRETIEEDETIMSAINRGLLEEFGAKGSVKNFIGSIKSEFPFKNKTGIVEKTTLYFHVELIEQDYAWRDKNDYEGNSNLVWLESAMLIKRMETQKSENYTGLDESMIIKNYLKLKNNKNE